MSSVHKVYIKISLCVPRNQCWSSNYEDRGFLFSHAWIYSPNLPPITLGVCHPEESGAACIAIGAVTDIILRTNHNQSNIKCQVSHLGQIFPKAQLVLCVQWDGKSRRTVKTGSFLQLIHQGKEVKMMGGSKQWGESVLLVMLHKMQ